MHSLSTEWDPQAALVKIQSMIQMNWQTARAGRGPRLYLMAYRKVLARAISQERAVERGKQPEEASSTEASDLEERLRKEGE